MDKEIAPLIRVIDGEREDHLYGRMATIVRKLIDDKEYIKAWAKGIIEIHWSGDKVHIHVLRRTDPD